MANEELGKAPAPQVSVVIPTYNGQATLGRVLAGLAVQTLQAIDYEVLVIDNNSTIDLFAGPGAQEALVALSNKGVHFHCVRESQQGLSATRARGGHEAKGAVICFLDDDNVPVSDYLSVGISAMGDPRVGLLVSRVFPIYECAPRPAVLRREHLLAINRAAGEKPIRWPAAVLSCPSIGAGMWVRKSIFESVCSTFGKTLLPDRTGSELISGGDIEIGIAVGKLGFDRMYVPGLVVNHHIPASRLEPAYFCRLIRGIVRSTVTLDYKYRGRRRSKVVRLAELLGCIALGWILALQRGDPIREYQFMIAAAYSRFEGPFVLA